MSESVDGGRRAGDESRIAEALIHLQYLRSGMDALNVRVGIQNGRLTTAEVTLVEMAAKATATVVTVQNRLAERQAEADRSMRLLAALIAVVGIASTVAMKYL